MRLTTAHVTRHLAEDELGAPEDHCPICLAEAPRRSVLTLQADPTVTLLECARCRGASASRMPRPEVLDRYYSTYYDGCERRITFPDANRFSRRLVAALPAVGSGSPFRILDFGGGDGSLALGVARFLLARDGNRRVDVLVVDRGEAAAPEDDRIAVHTEPRLPSRPEAYDLVLASAVLEHVPELHPVMAGLFAATGAGGFFYARTPYAVPIARLLPGIDLTFPAHVHDLGCGFWNRAASLFDPALRYVRSRPSPVAATWGAAPGRAAAAHLLKLPAVVEALLSPAGRPDRVWNLVGGWEVLLRRAS